MDKRKLLLSLIVLGSFLVSLALACSMFGNGTQHTFAQSSGVTVTDFWSGNCAVAHNQGIV